MTFLEAAIEVLRNESEGLHFSEIAKRAVERKLLSHVGRDPEAAMRSCLTSVMRGGAGDGIIERTKPGFYMIRPGAALPDPPAPPPVQALLGIVDTAKEREISRRSEGRSHVKDDLDAVAEERDEAEPSERPASSRRSRGRRSRAPHDGERHRAPATARGEPREVKDAAPAPTEAPPAAPPIAELAFAAPSGLGLEGVTDVAIVMANAMSRLADERPELRQELEAMQSRPEPQITTLPTRREMREKRSHRENREVRESREDAGAEDRAGRRRRRRRRRSRRVDWGEAQVLPVGENQREQTLARVAAVLEEAGPRALHIRQIAETLAGQGFLGGEVSEIERAVAAAILLDVGQRGETSMFAIRGEARYQLKYSRIPAPAARAQKALHEAIREAERQTREQLLAWLQSLGARALEALVRMYLEHEGFRLVGTLPLSRGLGKLIVDDPEAEEGEGRTLVLVVPAKTSIEPRLWEGEAERNECSSALVICMGEPPESVSGDGRILDGAALARWMLENGVGVATVTYQVPVLDAALIESIGGLDT